jgi:hypothetical protein
MVGVMTTDEVRLCKNCSHQLEERTYFKTHQGLFIGGNCLFRGCECDSPAAEAV